MNCVYFHIQCIKVILSENLPWNDSFIFIQHYTVFYRYMYLFFVGLHWWLWQAVEVRAKKPAGKGDNSHHRRPLSTGEKVQPLLHAVTAEVLSLSQKVSGKLFIQKANEINMLFSK